MVFRDPKPAVIIRARARSIFELVGQSHSKAQAPGCMHARSCVAVERSNTVRLSACRVEKGGCTVDRLFFVPSHVHKHRHSA